MPLWRRMRRCKAGRWNSSSWAGEQIPESLRTPIKNNAGGVYNHILYFNGMAPHHHLRPEGELKQALNRAFGGYDEFWKQMKAAGAGRFWLGLRMALPEPGGRAGHFENGKPGNTAHPWLCPILTVDVWEHAYYLKNQKPQGRIPQCLGAGYRLGEGRAELSKLHSGAKIAREFAAITKGQSRPSRFAPPFCSFSCFAVFPNPGAKHPFSWKLLLSSCQRRENAGQPSSYPRRLL